MINYHFDIEQGSEDWLALRRQMYITASEFQTVTGKAVAGRKTLLYKSAASIVTGLPEPFFENSAMAWGTEQEPFARMSYELETGNDVTQSGIVTSDLLPGIGASLDGLVGDHGTIEIKCPNSSTHIETVKSGKVPTKYKAQIQGGLWLSARLWCDFISYDPRIPSSKCIVIIRVPRDDDYIDEVLAPAVIKFSEEVRALSGEILDE